MKLTRRGLMASFVAMFAAEESGPIVSDEYRLLKPEERTLVAPPVCDENILSSRHRVSTYQEYTADITAVLLKSLKDQGWTGTADNSDYIESGLVWRRASRCTWATAPAFRKKAA